MSTLLDYLNRTYDVMAYQGVRARGDALLRPALFDEQTGGTICTGIQKLAQRFLIEFLTEKGSLPYRPLRGSSFMEQLRQGYLRTDTDVRIAFTFAIGEIGAQLVAEESATDPDDERYVAAELVGIAVAPGSATLSVTLTSRAGTSRAVILPIDTIV